jgi:hypothetical protein
VNASSCRAPTGARAAHLKATNAGARYAGREHPQVLRRLERASSTQARPRPPQRMDAGGRQNPAPQDLPDMPAPRRMARPLRQMRRPHAVIASDHNGIARSHNRQSEGRLAPIAGRDQCGAAQHVRASERADRRRPLQADDRLSRSKPAGGERDAVSESGAGGPQNHAAAGVGGRSGRHRDPCAPGYACRPADCCPARMNTAFDESCGIRRQAPVEHSLTRIACATFARAVCRNGKRGISSGALGDGQLGAALPASGALP